MIYTLGLDIGSTTSKCVVLGAGNEIIAKSLVKAGTGTNGPAQAFEKALAAGGIGRTDISYVMTTGYGRTLFTDRNAEMSELSAHAKGVYHAWPNVRTIIDIGGQDAKVIRVTDKGIFSGFVVNDKCAAGTGRFLDVMATVLQLRVDELAEYAARSAAPVKISSTCTVFAESEVISQLSRGVPLADLIKGICVSVANRVGALARRIGIERDVCMSGGVAKNGGVSSALEEELDTKIHIPSDAQYMGALGAAIAGFEKLHT